MTSWIWCKRTLISIVNLKKSIDFNAEEVKTEAAERNIENSGCKAGEETH
jgi:hypothetical protein